MNKAAAALTTIALAGVGIVGMSTSADATRSPGCVDRAEFRAVKKGMTQEQVQRKLHGLKGKVTYRSSLSISRDYNPCGDGGWGWVTIDLDRYNSSDMRVGYKSAYWG